jgi:PAS domain S-box-containing protein
VDRGHAAFEHLHEGESRAAFWTGCRLSLLMTDSPTQLESARSTALSEAALLDTPPEEEFDFLARLAAKLCGTEMAGITLLDGECQYYKSAIGHSGATIQQDESFCQYPVMSASTMVVEDTLEDERFRTSPLVVDGPRVRFYAGAPLKTPEGAVLGALCVMSTESHRLDAESVELLEGLAEQVSALVEQRRGDSQLRQQARGLRAAFDTALDPVFVTDDERRFVHVNRAACALLEYSQEELLDLKVEDLVAEPTREEAVAIWDGFVKHGTQRGEIKLRRAGGSEALAEYSASANFVPGRHLVVLRDVTERREAELESLASHRGLEETQALAQVGSWDWDLGSGLQIISEELHQILGRGSIAGEPTYAEFVDYVHPDDRASFLAVVERSLQSTKPFRQVFRVITESGEVRTIESHGRVQVSSKGEPVRMFGAAQDITEREQAAHDLRVQADILEELPVGVIATSPDRRIEQWNHGAEVLFGVSRAQAHGKRIDELGLIPGSSRELRKQMVERLSQGLPWEGEMDSQDATGRVFPSLVTNSPIRDRRDEVVGYVGVIVDLSDQKEAEADARAARIGTVTRLARAVEARDPETAGHIERIGEVATMLAERLGLDAEEVETIRLSSPMHDVGKIGISDEVLLKPGKLTPEERAAMELHPRIGYDILAGSHNEMLDIAASIALTHHEKVDGSGYPQGLKGDEIPLEGRIAAVADVFDALTSDRVYRRAFEFDRAMEMMRNGRGSHFDPRILDILLDDPESFKRVSRQP